MTNPTREDIIYAHKTLEYLIKNLYDIPLEEAKHTTSYERLAKFLPPRPQLTMDEIEWENDKHYLAEAEQCKYGKVIMLGLNENGSVVFITPNSREVNYSTAYPDSVTPTGKRYTLTEALRTHRSAEKNPN